MKRILYLILLGIAGLTIWWAIKADADLLSNAPVGRPNIIISIVYDTTSLDCDGDGVTDNYLTGSNITLKKGTGITLTLNGTILTIAATGTADSMGIDTDGNGTVDNYLYATTAGAFHIKKGANATLTVSGDTVTIAGAAGSGTADSMQADTSGGGVYAQIYSTGGYAYTIREGAGIDLTADNDTIYIATTLGTSIEFGEITATTSANWATRISDESGTGVMAFTTSPTFITPTLGAATATSYDGVAAANLLDKSATEVITGAWDFGGATSLEIPAVNDPTTDAEGEIAWDANDDALEVYMGDEGESALIPAYQTIDALIFAPDGVNDAIALFHVDAMVFPFGIEIDQLSIGLPADAAYEMAFEEWAGDPIVLQNAIDTVITGAADGYMEESAITDAAIDADDYIYISIPATDVDWIHVQIIYHINDGN